MSAFAITTMQAAASAMWELSWEPAGLFSKILNDSSHLAE